MKRDWILTVAVSAITLLAYASVAEAAERGASGATHAEKSANAKARYYSNRRPLEVNIYPLRRRGGYSYRASDVIGTYDGSPPPYLDIRQTPGGPFDSGFFFDSGVGGPPFIGRQSPYLH